MVRFCVVAIMIRNEFTGRLVKRAADRSIWVRSGAGWAAKGISLFLFAELICGR